MIDGRRPTRPRSTRPVALNDALRREEKFGLYFKEEVRKQLVERFGWERVYQGGLKVYTTIDPATQKAAESEVARASARDREAARRAVEKPPTGAVEEPLQAALVAMDPHTGEVRALVGGRDFSQSSFNRATQARRQPGSAFKPFVYAAALEAGYRLRAVLTNLNEPVMTLEGEWVPEDEHLDNPIDDDESGAADVEQSCGGEACSRTSASRRPSNTPSGSASGSVPSVPSLALGSGEVTLMSMTAAFGTFANGGMVPRPR